MLKTILVLMMISTAISAYLRGRREGTWSWRLFAKTIFAICMLGAGAGILGIWLSRVLGPEHALLVTVLVVVVIAVGVLLLTLYVRKKTENQRQ